MMYSVPHIAVTFYKGCVYIYRTNFPFIAKSYVTLNGLTYDHVTLGDVISCLSYLNIYRYIYLLFRQVGHRLEILLYGLPNSF